MGHTFFSIIIPAHNKRPHLERSINSVLKQSYPNFELLIIDDASTDGSTELLTTFNDKRIRLFRREHAGPGGYAARNMGIAEAKFDWICFLDADDSWEVGLLKKVNDIIINAPSVNILSWGWRYIKGNESRLDEFSILKSKSSELFLKYGLKDFLNGPQPIWTGAVAIKKSIFNVAGNFPEDRCKRGGDLDMWIRCLNVSEENIWINEVMSNYYIDSVNMVTKSATATYPCPCYSLSQILENTTDKDLIKSIYKFQNKMFYSVVERNVRLGNAIDYSLLSNMTMSYYTFSGILKIHVKRLIGLLKR